MATVTKPNVFIAGVPKGGTTALANILAQHPQVFLPKRKEPRFYMFRGETLDPKDPVNGGVVQCMEDYLALFEPGAGCPVVIDGSAGYFGLESAMRGIAKEHPEAKIVLLLRDPVERAFSHFIFSVRQGYEPADARITDVFEHDTVTLESGFVRKRRYLMRGYYDQHLNLVYEIFPRENVFIRTSEHFQQDQAGVLNALTKFLGIDGFRFDLDVGEFAKSGIPRNRWLSRAFAESRFLKNVLPDPVAAKLRDFKRNVANRNLVKPELADEDRARLVAHFRPHVEALRELVELDTSLWRNF